MRCGVTLKHLLKRGAARAASPGGGDLAQSISPMKALALLSKLQSADIVLPTTDGREIRLRRVTELDREQKFLLRQLGIALPQRLQLNKNCSVDSATA